MIQLSHFPVQTGRHRVSFYDQFTVISLRRHPSAEQWYRDLDFPIRNLNNLNPYRELERLALRLPRATRTRSEVQGVMRSGVIIEPRPRASRHIGETRFA